MADKNSQSIPMRQYDYPRYKNPQLHVDERVSDLLARMTLEEKVAQMICVWDEKKNILFDEQGKLSLKDLGRHLKDGLGQIARLGDTDGGLTPRQTAELANELQKYFIEETRLGIPVFFHEECLHGLVGKDATSYPQPIGLASTFDPELVESIYTAISSDARSRGIHQALTPVVDVARDPRWGRVEETFGEDPYLVAQMGIEVVKGFQGDATFRTKDRIVATLKHFVAHGQPESGTNCAPVNVSERLLRDTFLYTFREVLAKANAVSVMASYNEIDGVPSHANVWLLRDVLRGEWKFKGFVISDDRAIPELNIREETNSHSLARDKDEAAVLAVRAGVNLEILDPVCYPNLVKLVRDGTVRVSLLDELVAPLLRYKFIMGLFEDPYVNPDALETDLRLERERKLALRAARETVVLLKNENGILPLEPDMKRTIAVIGPNADRKLLGGYSGEPRFYTTVLQGIRNRVGGGVNVVYAEGCRITVGGSWSDDLVTFPDPEENRRLIREAVEVAQKSDFVILAIGDNEQTSREAWKRTHLGDRASLDLFGMQNDLVRAISETGKQIVVVLFGGRPASINYIQNNIPAILECWYLGQETGNSIADVLFGDYNPGGKLPITFPRSAGHIPCYYNHKPSARRGYLGDDVTPLYPFGYGLSYTTFALSNLRIEKSVIKSDESTAVFVDIKNTGTRIGDEVLQLYIRDIFSSVTRPVKELRGFKRVTIKPGESKTVAFTLSPEHLAFTNIDKEWTVEPGDFDVMVGTSSRDQDLMRARLRVL